MSLPSIHVTFHPDDPAPWWVMHDDGDGIYRGALHAADWADAAKEVERCASAIFNRNYADWKAVPDS